MLERKTVRVTKRFSLYNGMSMDALKNRIKEAEKLATKLRREDRFVGIYLDKYVVDHYRDGPETEFAVTVAFTEPEPEDQWQHRLNEERNKKEMRRLQYERLKEEFEGGNGHQ